MNKTCRFWHAVYSAAAVAIGMNTAALMGEAASTPTETQTIIDNSNSKL